MGGLTLGDEQVAQGDGDQCCYVLHYLEKKVPIVVENFQIKFEADWQSTEVTPNRVGGSSQPTRSTLKQCGLYSI
jgi:hypothetical protein